MGLSVRGVQDWRSNSAIEVARSVSCEKMETSSTEEHITHKDSEPVSASTIGGLTFDGDAQKHFDAFEALFFQQGDEANLSGADDTYAEPRRVVSYRTLTGISITSTGLAVLACIALWRGNAPAATIALARPATQGVTTPAVLVTVPVALPAALPAAPAAIPTPPSLENPSAPVAAARPSVPAIAPPPSPAAALEPPLPLPNGESSAAKLAKAAEPRIAKADAPKAEQAMAEAPQMPATAPARDSETRERCQRSIREKRAKEIVTVCSTAFEEDATNADAAVAVAKVEFDRGRFAQAYAWSKKAISVNPASADAYVFAGGAEQNQGHGKAAKEAYLHYLRLAPSGRYASEIRTIVGSL